jgi:hypothetical protein
MKYHIGKDGTPKRCRATKACPYGSISDHFNTVEEGQAIADDLNEQLQNAKSFGIAKSGNWVQLDKETEFAVVKLNNLRITMNRLDNIKNNARKQILDSMKDLQVKSIKDETATLSFVEGKPTLGVDTEKLKESGLYEDYSKETNPVQEHLQLKVERTDKVAKFEEKMTMPSGESINFNLSVDEDGVAHIDDETKNALRKLKEFEDTIKQTKELEKQLRAELMESMKNANVNEIKVGTASLEYVPEHTRTIVDTKKLKDNGLYEEYSKYNDKADSIRIKFN